MKMRYRPEGGGKPILVTPSMDLDWLSVEHCFAIREKLPASGRFDWIPEILRPYMRGKTKSRFKAFSQVGYLKCLVT